MKRTGCAGGVLLAIICLAAALRFYHLGAKALWLDEIVTIVCALGRGPDDLSPDVAMPLEHLDTFLRPGQELQFETVLTSLREPRVNHTHPPLFYLLSHAWLVGTQPDVQRLPEMTRVLPAFFGVAVVFSMYLLGRAAFSRNAGLMAAALAAVSPLMVLVSQEARNYTLPLFFITCALAIGVAIDRRLAAGSVRPALWAGWALCCVLALYSHYHAAFAIAGQAAALALGIARAHRLGTAAATVRRAVTGLLLALAAIALAFLPWSLTLLEHVTSDGLRRWVGAPRGLNGIVKTFQGPIAMLVIDRITVDTPDLWLGWGLAVILYAIAIMGVLMARVARLRLDPDTARSIAFLGTFILTVWAGMIFTGVALGQNFLLVPRFHFPYYPAVCALAAVCLLPRKQVVATERSWSSTLAATVVAVSLVSSLLIVNNYAVPKRYRPAELAENVLRQSSGPAVFAMGQHQFHNASVALAYALELRRNARSDAWPMWYALPLNGVNEADDMQPGLIWQGLLALRGIPQRQFDLWVAGPGLKFGDFPAKMTIGLDSTSSGERGASCVLDPRRRYDNERNGRVVPMFWLAVAIGIKPDASYAMYRCLPGTATALVRR